MKVLIVFLAIICILTTVSICLTIREGKTQGVLNNSLINLPNKIFGSSNRSLLTTKEANDEILDIHIEQVCNGNGEDKSYITVIFDIVYPADKILRIEYVTFGIRTYDGETLVADSKIVYESSKYSRGELFSNRSKYDEGKTCLQGIANIYLNEYINGDFSFEYDIYCSQIYWKE